MEEKHWMAEFERWLQERVDWYTDWCLQNVAERGYPGKIKFAQQDMRYALEAYQETLAEFRKRQSDRVGG